MVHGSWAGMTSVSLAMLHACQHSYMRIIPTGDAGDYLIPWGLPTHYIGSVTNSNWLFSLIPSKIMKYTQAKDLMTRDVQTVEADRPLHELADFFLTHGITGAPVVDEDDQLIGVVSMTDLATHQNAANGHSVSTGVPHDVYQTELAGQYAPEEVEGLRISETTTATVRDIMTPEVYDVNPHTSVQQVASVMLRSEIHRLFVTRNGEVEGVITATDMLKVVRDL